MNLRFIERDGKKILQQSKSEYPGADLEVWFDIPVVTEPRKAREWMLCKNELGWHATPRGTPLELINYRGSTPTEIVYVREVLDPTGGRE